jgi:hypothetical protein
MATVSARRRAPGYEATCCVWEHGLRVAVECPTAAVFTTVQDYLSSWCGPSPGSGDGPRRHLTIQISAAGYCLAEGWRPLGTARDLPGILAAFQEWMDCEVAGLTTCTPIHAGVVVLGGRALLLPAASGAGKSTLVAALLARGAGYFSDEFALLDEEGRVHPYPRPLQMRDAVQHRRSVPASAWHAPVGGEALDVSLILSLRFVMAGRLRLRPIAASEAAVTLLRNTPHRLDESKSLAATVLLAVRNAPAFEGIRGEAAQAADAIVQWADGAGGGRLEGP